MLTIFFLYWLEKVGQMHNVYEADGGQERLRRSHEWVPLCRRRHAECGRDISLVAKVIQHMCI